MGGAGQSRARRQGPGDGLPRAAGLRYPPGLGLDGCCATGDSATANDTPNTTKPWSTGHRPTHDPHTGTTPYRSESRYVVGNTDESHFEEIAKELDGRRVRLDGTDREVGRRDRDRAARQHRLRTGALRTTTEGSKATYQQRYEDADDGLRFQELTYTGNFVGMEPVTDGVPGDKMMRARAESKVLERLSKEDALREQATIEAPAKRLPLFVRSLRYSASSLSCLAMRCWASSCSHASATGTT